jgi:hypothetical protein
VRDLGASLVVQAAGTAEDLGVTGAPTTTDSSAGPILIPADVNAALALPSDDPVRSAQRIAVGLLRFARAHSTSDLVLMPDPATANPRVLRALTDLLGSSDSLQAVDIEQLGPGAAPSTGGTAPRVADFNAARSRRTKLQKLVDATSGILPADDPRRTSWPIRADVLLDTRLADDERAAYETQLRADLLAVQDSVLVETPPGVNLGDRNTGIPITIENTGTVSVSVVVRLVSAKLRHAAVSEVLSVEPGETRSIRVPVSTRSNGRFPVTAELLAPGTDLVVGKPVVVNVRVGQLAGLGIFLTFGFVLALLSWWTQHLRRRWRKEATQEIERRRLAGLPIDDLDDFAVLDPAASEPTQEQQRIPGR